MDLDTRFGGTPHRPDFNSILAKPLSDMLKCGGFSKGGRIVKIRPPFVLYTVVDDGDVSQGVGDGLIENGHATLSSCMCLVD